MAVLEQPKVLSGEGERAASRVAPQRSAPLVRPLTRDFLVWVAVRPRSYGETMEGWRTSCPRFSIWEDALHDDLVRVDPNSGKPYGEATVSLTIRGRELLDSTTIGAAEGAAEGVSDA